YVCRGGANSKHECDFDFYFDHPTNDASSLQANFNGIHPAGNAKTGPSLDRTTKVGSYKANRLGVFDMHGNVSEWCLDVFGRASVHVIRGGVWFTNSQDCRASYRYEDTPEDRNRWIGFRLARVPRGEQNPIAQ